MAGVFTMISRISFVLAGIFIVASAFLWFKFNIPVIYGEFSGKTAKKSIERIREKNENSGRKSFLSSVVNYERGKVTEDVEDDLDIDVSNGMNPVSKTDRTVETGVLADGSSIEPVADETTVLIDDATVVLTSEEKAHNVISTGTPGRRRVALRIIDEVICIHTDEKIR